MQLQFQMSIILQLQHPHPVVHSVSAHPRKPAILSAASSNIFLWDVPKMESDD